jgi:hypothetical protein
VASRVANELLSRRFFGNDASAVHLRVRTLRIEGNYRPSTAEFREVTKENVQHASSFFVEESDLVFQSMFEFIPDRKELIWVRPNVAKGHVAIERVRRSVYRVVYRR